MLFSKKKKKKKKKNRQTDRRTTQNYSSQKSPFDFFSIFNVSFFLFFVEFLNLTKLTRLEISVLSQIGTHQNVIEFLGVYSLNNTMYIIFEFAEQGDLKRLLDQFRKCNRNQDIAVDTSFQMKASIDIANGMDYISSLELVHKDLAARNILIDANFNFKVSDFGSCNSISMTKRPIR